MKNASLTPAEAIKDLLKPSAQRFSTWPQFQIGEAWSQVNCFIMMTDLNITIRDFSLHCCYIYSTTELIKVDPEYVHFCKKMHATMSLKWSPETKWPQSTGCSHSVCGVILNELNRPYMAGPMKSPILQVHSSHQWIQWNKYILFIPLLELSYMQHSSDNSKLQTELSMYSNRSILYFRGEEALQLPLKSHSRTIVKNQKTMLTLLFWAWRAKIPTIKDPE